MSSTPQPPEIPVRRVTKVEWMDAPPPAPSSLPVPLTSSAMAINDTRRVLLVGGYAAATSECVSSVAEYDSTSKVWSSVSIPQFPYPISEASMASVGSRFFVYGGWDGAHVRGDVHVFNPPSSGGAAAGAAATASPLSATTTSTAVVSGVNAAATNAAAAGASSAAGGLSSSPSQSSPPTGNQWECIFEGPFRGGRNTTDAALTTTTTTTRARNTRSSSSSSSFPKARRGASMVAGTLAGRSVLFIFGGYDGARRLADLWAFDVDRHEWIEVLASPLSSSSSAISHRRLANATDHHDKNRLAIIGDGNILQTSSGGGGTSSNGKRDFHFHRASYDASYATDEAQQRSELSTAAGNMNSMTGATTTTTPLPPLSTSLFKGSRYLAHSLLGPQQLFCSLPRQQQQQSGGAGSVSATSSSATLLQGQGYAATPPPPSSGSTASTQSPQQQKFGSAPLAHASHSSPSPRDGAAMAFDTLQNRIIVYGGYSETIVGDIFELRFSADIQIVSRKSVEKGADASTEEDIGSSSDEEDEEVEESENEAGPTKNNQQGQSPRKGKDLVVGPEYAQWKQLTTSTTNAPPSRYGCSLALISGTYFIVGFGVEAPSNGSAAGDTSSSRVAYLVGAGGAAAAAGVGAQQSAATAATSTSPTAASGSNTPAAMMLVATPAANGVGATVSPAKASGNGGLGGPTRLIYQLNLADLSWTIANTEGDETIDGRAGCAVGTSSDAKKSVVLGGLTADGRYLYSGLEIEWERAEVVPVKARK